MKNNRLKYGTQIIYVSFLLMIIFISCRGMENSVRPLPEKGDSGKFVTVSGGIKIFVYQLIPDSNFKSSIFVISGITGINHVSEKEMIGLLSDNKNRVVVIHPHGTGYSEGRRGDIDDFSDFISDYVEIIKGDRYYCDSTRKVILYGHSMSCAVALRVATELNRTDGIILVNPPYILKKARGMAPGIVDYLRYAGYYIFAPHVPVVNMAGNPAVMENESDRKESENRCNDSLLVKYFSMYYMSRSKKIIDEMANYSEQSDYPLLLLYGDNDNIVDKKGCDMIYSYWKNNNKSYEIIKGGSHGGTTVSGGAEIISKWIEKIGHPVTPVF